MGKAGENENVSAIFLRQNQVWKPDFVLQNTVENIKMPGNSDHSVTIARNGDVLWEPGQRFKSVCEVNIRFYPFDSQVCTFWFGSWTYYNETNASLSKLEIELSAYTRNGKWEIEGSNGYAAVIDYGFISQPTMLFSLNLRRRRTYYVLTTCIPVVILYVLNCLVHVLSADSGEKMSFCMIILLSYMVFISFLNDSLPSTVVVYLVSVIALSSLSVINSVVVLYKWNKVDAKEDDGIAELPCSASITEAGSNETGNDNADLNSLTVELSN